MSTAGFVNPPLRGYVPYGELDVNYDLMRQSMAFHVPMWEGSDRPFGYSPNLPHTDGIWTRPELINPPHSPRWNSYAPGSGFTAGAPKSGHAAVWAPTSNSTAATAVGFDYQHALDPFLSEFLVQSDFSVLLVGTPMIGMNPDLPPGSRSNSLRDLWNIRTLAGINMQYVRCNYQTEVFSWQSWAVGSVASPVIPIYGRRVAMLFVAGEEEGAWAPPRVFIGDEDGVVERADFSTIPSADLLDAHDVQLFCRTGDTKDNLTGGGCWEYFAFYIRAFHECEARSILRDAMGAVKWDPYVARRIGWQARDVQLIATPGSYGRVSVARAYSFGRVAATPTPVYKRVSASPRQTGARVAATPNTFPRVSARIRIAAEEVFDVQATPLCPSEMNWEADNVLELADVLDDMQVPPAEITSADSVTCEIYDKATGAELTSVSPVTLTQVGSTNAWRESVLTNAANGFSRNQRLTLVFIFDGGVGLHGRFEALSVVGAATS